MSRSNFNFVDYFWAFLGLLVLVVFTGGLTVILCYEAGYSSFPLPSGTVLYKFDDGYKATLNYDSTLGDRNHVEEVELVEMSYEDFEVGEHFSNYGVTDDDKLVLVKDKTQ